MLFALIVNGQENRNRDILVSGIVAEKDSLNVLSNAQIYINNIHNGETGEDGRFVLRLEKGDTLLIEKADFAPYHLVISDSLKQPYYIMGIKLDRLSADNSSEVLLPTRFNMNSNNTFGVSAKDLRNATNNLRLSAYTAVTRRPQTYDADMNTDMALRKYESDMGYKGMLSPDDMYSFNILTAIFLVYGTIRNFTDDKEFEKFKLTPEEKDLIFNILEKGHK